MSPTPGAFLAVVPWGRSFVIPEAAWRELSPITLITTSPLAGHAARWLMPRPLFVVSGGWRESLAPAGGVIYPEPLVTLAAGVALLGEAVHLTTVPGGRMALAGVFLVERAVA